MTEKSTTAIKELKPKITVFGVGGAGGNAVNNMIRSGLQGCEFVVANTDSQALASSKADQRIQMGVAVTEGLGAGSQPEVGRAAAEEAIDEIGEQLTGSHMVFVTAGMGGGTGTGAAPIVARLAREQGILTVGVVTKPFQFEGVRRMRVAEAGIKELEQCVDTLIVIPNQNLFRIANEKTTFADAFAMADQVLYSGVACITDLMVKEGLINLDFADVRSVMREMGKAMMGTGEASGERRATEAAEAAIANPLLDETSMRGAQGLLISITGGKDLTLFEVDEAATRIREEIDPDANIILGATFEEELEGVIRVSVVATGIDAVKAAEAADAGQRLRAAALAAQHSSTPSAAPAQPPRIQPQADPEMTVPEESSAAPTSFDLGIAGFGAQPGEAEEDDTPAEAPFIPPTPEAPTRIPRVEDFPPVAQRQIEAQRDRKPEPSDRGPMGLLRRLASASLGRREEPQPARREARPAPQRTARPAGKGEARDRPAKGDLDSHGRQIPNVAPNRPQEDELEIPAFLRRQAN